VIDPGEPNNSIILRRNEQCAPLLGACHCRPRNETEYATLSVEDGLDWLNLEGSC
jgi:hypothetical protein